MARVVVNFPSTLRLVGIGPESNVDDSFKMALLILFKSSH